MPKKPSILIADDDRVFVTLVSDFLRKQGYNVMVAFDAMQALMRARQAAPSAMVLDINMPGGTGVEALKKVRLMSSTSQIPVIVVTGAMDARVAEEVKRLGAEEFLTKPIELPRLQEAIDRVVQPH